MVDFRSSANKNTKEDNKVIMSLGTTLQTEREAFSRARGELQTDTSAMIVSVVSKIEQLQKDLAAENEIMDKLVAKTEKVMVLSLKLNYANKHLDDLKTEKVVIKRCISEINQYMHRMVETRDSLLNVSIRQNLLEKLQPVFDMFNQIKGVSKVDSLPKQGGEC